MAIFNTSLSFKIFQALSSTYISEMMQLECAQPSWPYYNTLSSPLEEGGFFFSNMDRFEFYSSSISIEDFSDASSSIPLSSPWYTNESHSFPAYCYKLPVTLPMDQCFLNLEDDTNLGDHLMFDEAKDVSELMASEDTLSSEELFLESDVRSNLNASSVSSEASVDVPSAESTEIMLCDDYQVDHTQLSMFHLLKAFGEATQMEQKGLAEEITRRLKEKASPTGSTLQRLACYLMQASEVGYLRQVASQNYDAAFKAFYEIFPYGRFAHFTANSVVLEAIPEDVHMVHIVDFDIGNGIQWPPLIEFLARRGLRLVRLTSVKWKEEDSNVPHSHRFQQTKARLHEHAQTCGVRLMVEEMDMEALPSEIKKTKKRSGGKEWLAFNCMVGLPQMGTQRSIRHVLQFLEIAKDSINFPARNCYGRGSSLRGVATFADGSGTASDSRGYASFFEGKLVEFQVLLKSMECHLPSHLVEARITMECLFLTQHFSSLADFQMWEETNRKSRAPSEVGLEAWKMRPENILEAKELAREGESLFSVTIQGEQQNQAVLGYMGTPLVRVSSWR